MRRCKLEDGSLARKLLTDQVQAFLKLSDEALIPERRSIDNRIGATLESEYR